MTSETLQNRIRMGDRDAFRALYGEHSREVYLTAQELLADDAKARAAVKGVFLRIYREILEADAPIDTDSRIAALTQEEILLQKNSGAPRRLDRRTAQSAPTPQGVRTGETAVLLRTKARYAHLNTPETAPKKRRVSAWSVIGVVLAVLFFLLLVWLVLGVLMTLCVFPTIDLGYRGFDRIFFPLFKL